LGEFPAQIWSENPPDWGSMIGHLLELYRSHPDSGVHGSTKWLLRRLGREADLARIDSELAVTPMDLTKCHWRIGPLGMTFVAMIDPSSGRGVEVADAEVTVRQFVEFRKDHVYNRAVSPSPDHPMNTVSCDDAMAFCNWLSGRDGIEVEQHAYRLLSDGRFAPFEDTSDRLGYRLLTESEAESACRAGATTSRYFGDSDALLARYAWHLQNAGGLPSPPAGLKPNDFGLFDTLGNMVEWCIRSRDDDRYQNQIITGGSFRDSAKSVHSSRSRLADATMPYVDSGFRVAKRTCELKRRDYR
jgi:hypothetical protein